MYGLGLVRIVFGVVLAIDASLKWYPAFSAGFVKYLTDAAEGQPENIKVWIAFWIGLVHSDPLLFAHTVAILETLVAIGLVFGVFSTVVDACGALLMLVIWSTAEGFGGPYNPGSTDIGAAIIYVVVFAALFFTRAGLYLGLDRFVSRKLGRWSWLASGRVPNDSGALPAQPRGAKFIAGRRFNVDSLQTIRSVKRCIRMQKSILIDRRNHHVLHS